jgi:hypothetical protein
MAKPSTKKQTDEIPPLAFDDALRKILKAPPQHKAAKVKKRTGS